MKKINNLTCLKCKNLADIGLGGAFKKELFYSEMKSYSS